jgi:hypothetical protein
MRSRQRFAAVLLVAMFAAALALAVLGAAQDPATAPSAPRLTATTTPGGGR